MQGHILLFPTDLDTTRRKPIVPDYADSSADGISMYHIAIDTCPVSE